MAEQIENIINKMAGGAGTATTGIDERNNRDQKFFCDAKGQGLLNDFIDTDKPKLVALVGFADYGKSTFIGSLYQLLIEKFSYGGYRFVDSETYVGFERRIFLRRVNNEDTSDTKRNILGESDVLHFKLCSEKGKYNEILVSDKAGETYTKYTSSDGEITKDIVLANADLIVFFVDAEEDSRSLAAHNLIAEKYESLLTRLKTQQKIVDRTPYVVVFTKTDKVSTEDRKKKLADRKEKMCAVFSSNLGVAPNQIYEVNSKALDDEQLNQVFYRIIQPKEKGEDFKKLDWVKTEIEKEL